MVFDAKKDVKRTTEVSVFMILSVIGLGINQIMMWLLVDVGQLYHMWSKVLATVVVMVDNFITRKLLTERK